MTYVHGSKVSINDQHHILNQKHIIFNSKEELNQELSKLLKIMLAKGYATSSITFHEGEIKVIPGRINKVELEDNSTLLPGLKKYLFDMNLENKILNIKDINKILAKYNSLSSNKAKVSIEDSKKKHYSNVLITNDYQFKLHPQFELEFSKDLNSKNEYHTVDLGLEFEQILGFNDSFRINVSPQTKSKYYKLNYTLPVRNLTLGLNYQKHKNTDGKFYTGRKETMGLSTNLTLYESPRIKLSHLSSAERERKKQYIKNTLIIKDYLYKYQTGLNLRSYILYDKNIFTLNINPNIAYNSKKHKSPLLVQDDVSCIKSDVSAGFYSKYYTLNAFLAYSKSKKGGEIFDNDCKYSNSIREFDEIPVNYNSAHVYHANNTFKFPIKFKQGSISPFVEFATYKDMVEDESGIGAGLGMILTTKYLNLGAKYGQSKKDKAFSLKFNLYF